jgi:hypothetical protein
MKPATSVTDRDFQRRGSGASSVATLVYTGSAPLAG